MSNDLCDPDLDIASFGRLLKTHLFQQYSMHRAPYKVNYKYINQIQIDTDNDIMVSVRFTNHYFLPPRWSVTQMTGDRSVGSYATQPRNEVR